MDLCFICTVVSMRKKANKKYICIFLCRIFVFECLLPLQFDSYFFVPAAAAAAAVDTYKRMHASTILFFIFFSCVCFPPNEIWSVDLNTSKYYGFYGWYNVIKIERDERKNEKLSVRSFRGAFLCVRFMLFSLLIFSCYCWLLLLLLLGFFFFFIFWLDV